MFRACYAGKQKKNDFPRPGQAPSAQSTWPDWGNLGVTAHRGEPRSASPSPAHLLGQEDHAWYSPEILAWTEHKARTPPHPHPQTKSSHAVSLQGSGKDRSHRQCVPSPENFVSRSSTWEFTQTDSGDASNPRHYRNWLSKSPGSLLGR